MTDVKGWFSRKTAKIRYRMLYSIMKYVTPSLYKRMTYEKIMAQYKIRRTPRPSTRFMKKYFKNKSLIGAEIGVDAGKNALSLLKMLNIEKLYLVDMYKERYFTGGVLSMRDPDAYDKAIKRLGVYGNKIQFIVKPSVEAVNVIDKTLDFVYIDANHQYEYVYEDLDAWYPLVKIGGVVCGHDILNIKSVLDAVKDWCVDNCARFIIDSPDWYFVKDEKIE